jgi:hypothetical protein
MVYFANSQHIYFLSELTFCTTILVYHVLLYVVVPQESPEGWMGPIPKGTHYRVCVSPRFSIRGRSTFGICEARICFIPKGVYLRSDAVHAAINAWVPFL